MKVKTKRKLVTVAIIMAILVVASVAAITLSSMRPEPPKKPIMDKAMLVEILELTPSDVTFEINSQGTVSPRTETVLSAEVSGRIIAISDKFIAGGLFKKGEVLLQIDATDYQVAVAQADALLKQREIEFKAAKSLRSKGYRAESELAASKASLAAAKASLVKAQKNLERTNISLPYDGLVRTKNSDIGQFVNPGTRLGTTFATNTAEIRLALTDQDLAFLDLPAAGFITDGANSGPDVILSAVRKGQIQRWHAKIIRSEGVVDVKSRVTYVVAQINDPYRLSENDNWSNKSALPVGTFVRATIKGNSYSNIIKVPRSAMRGKNQLMFVDSENRLRIKEVNVLKTDSSFAYIQEESYIGKRISITAIESPINGMKLRTADQQVINEKVVVNSADESRDNALQTQSN